MCVTEIVGWIFIFQARAAELFDADIMSLGTLETVSDCRKSDRGGKLLATVLHHDDG